MRFARIKSRGRNVRIFEKKGPFWILLRSLFLRKRVILDSIKGRLWVIFQTPPNIHVLQKACLGVKLGAKLQEILL